MNNYNSGPGIRRPSQHMPQQAPAKKEKKDSGGMLGGIMGGGGGGMMSGMLSDKESKEEIQRLEGANEALARALSTKPEYPDTSAPSSGLRALGQQAAPPSQASFPDAPQPSPAAQQVAAQNQVMAPAAAPQVPQQPAPRQPNQNPGFNPQLGRPDLTALDEAYARLGRSYGG